MRLGSIVTLGFSPGGRFGLLPPLGYVLGGAGPVEATTIHGGDDDINVDQVAIWRKQRDDEIAIAVIKTFLNLT